MTLPQIREAQAALMEVRTNWEIFLNAEKAQMRGERIRGHLKRTGKLKQQGVSAETCSDFFLGRLHAGLKATGLPGQEQTLFHCSGKCSYLAPTAD